MLPLLFAALADTVMVPIDETDIVEMHEWGVIELSVSSAEVVGSPVVDMVPPDPDFCVEAPVIWFHGVSFDGELTVHVPNGRVTVTYPEPSFSVEGGDGVPASVSWELTTWPREPDTADGQAIPAEEYIPELGAYYDAVASWRAVPSRQVASPDGSWSDRFVYYECEVEDLMGAPPAGAGPEWLLRDVHAPGLLLRTSDSGLPEQRPCLVDGGLPEPQGDWAPVETGELELTMCSWSGGVFRTEEVSALVETWEAAMTSVPAGERLLVFPLPRELYGSVSLLALTTERGHYVVQKRFFLCMTALEG